MRIESSWIGFVFFKGGSRELSHPFPSHEDTVRRQLSMNQEAGSYQTLNMPVA